jgi:hypothetical protein
MATLLRISLALFIAAEAFVVAGVGAASLPVVAGWALAAIAIAVMWRRVHSSLVRVIVAALVMVACVLLVSFEGLFFLPAATVLFAAAVMSRRPGRAVHVGR